MANWPKPGLLEIGLCGISVRFMKYMRTYTFSNIYMRTRCKLKYERNILWSRNITEKVLNLIYLGPVTYSTYIKSFMNCGHWLCCSSLFKSILSLIICCFRKPTTTTSTFSKYISRQAWLFSFTLCVAAWMMTIEKEKKRANMVNGS